MTLRDVVLPALKVSIMLLVLALGLLSTQKEALYLLTRPRLLFRSMLAMTLVMPIVAAALAAGFNLNPAVKIALVALSVSPVPPLFPRKAIKAAGENAYPVGLLVAAALLAVVFVPFAIDVLGNAFGKPVHVPVATVVKVVLSAVLAPLAVGILLRRWRPELAHRMARPVSFVGNILLIAVLVPILFTAGKAMWSLVGNGTLASFAFFIIAGLVSGHLLGGPPQNQRPVLALATAMRHPGMALAIATTTFPQQKLVMPAVLLYLILAAFLTALYLNWYRRTQPASREERLAA
ncbi:MAG TPA: bile acid:sodium symporter [Terriglobales bacterium]|nr:bile acid:sodium symporter [Terriglobales bacterium]